ncbi:zinc finger protein 57, partial [Homo sapiens]
MLETFRNLASVDDGTQFKANGSVSLQDMYGQEKSKEQTIPNFTGNNSCAYTLEKNCEGYGTEDHHKNLRNHMVDRFCTHNEGNQYGEAIHQMPDLTLHKKVSAGEKPYECTKCRTVFTHLSSLKRHVKSHCGRKAPPGEECKQACICPSHL